MAVFFKTIIACVFAVSFLSCNGVNESGGAVEPSSSYNFKTGAYIEASRNETFSICPEEKSEGTWVSEHSVALNERNCLSVQAPNLSGTFRVLFMENSGRTDTIQVLVDQSYIQMGDYSHVIFVADTNTIIEGKNRKPVPVMFVTVPGSYESISYSQPLIVDKTKFTMGDAQYYFKYEGEKLEGSRLPLVNHNDFAWLLANERSKKEGLDTAYYKNSSGKVELDSSASGYRVPFRDEWSLLMRAGASTRYFFGDTFSDEEFYSYVWPSTSGLDKLMPVAQLLPNDFGLYDMVSNARESCEEGYESYLSLGGFELCNMLGHAYESFRLLRKTPKLHKLEKF